MKENAMSEQCQLRSERHKTILGIDGNLCFATRQYMKVIASLFGVENVFVLSVDDKPKVPIGVTPTINQYPLIMHADHEIRLPDYGFVNAAKQNLALPVYDVCEIHAISSKCYSRNSLFKSNIHCHSQL